MGTQSRYQLGCLSRLVITLLEVSEREEGVVAVKNPPWVGAATKMRTQHLPLADDIAAAPSGPVVN